MNIKILDSHLREFLKTKATPQQIAEKLSLSSVSVERLEKYKNDYLYDIEITTNRPDLMSVIGLARESAAVLNQNNINSEFIPPNLPEPVVGNISEKIEIVGDSKLSNRICAVIMEVKYKPSPEDIKNRLEAAGMRSLNILIDVTNYITRTIGHSAHVFDFDRLNTKKLFVKESKKGDTIVTLDKKTHILPGGDIIAVDDNGRIVDLLGIMGLENSVVTKDTKRILFFLNNNEPLRMRRTSMTLGIRTEAVILNEKGTDTELTWDAFLYGIKLYEELADGKIISELIDIYPNKSTKKTVTITEQRINSVIGVNIPIDKSADILKQLGFTVKQQNNSLTVTPPVFRNSDIEIAEDLIEEIARIYGYHNIPSCISTASDIRSNHFVSEFYWEDRVKDALKYWGFTECYTYSMISEKIAGGNVKELVKIKNPLDDDHVYMRSSLIPSLIEVSTENKERENIKIFELAKVYIKKHNTLPDETRTLAGFIKGKNSGFFDAKGIVEQILIDLGIKNYEFEEGVEETAKLFVRKEFAGIINILPGGETVFEVNFDLIAKSATDRKTYKPASKFPPFVEDLALVVDGKHKTGDIIDEIKKQSNLIRSVELFDKFENTRTFHIVYQSYEKNLSRDEIAVIREKILTSVKQKFHAVTK